MSSLIGQNTWAMAIFCSSSGSFLIWAIWSSVSFLGAAASAFFSAGFSAGLASGFLASAAGLGEPAGAAGLGASSHPTRAARASTTQKLLRIAFI